MANALGPQYPVILVHGIIAHDRGRRNFFWGRIPRVLKEKGVRVYFGNTDAWGSFETNAKILQSTIERALRETGTEKVNIIAHSKGGLDSRYCIWKYGYGNKVASLTTVSTPHRGSELADLIYKQKIVHSGFAKWAFGLFGKLYGDSNPDLYAVINLLTTGAMKEFNESVDMDGRVYCQSVYTTMKGSADDLLFSGSHLYMKRVCGENDGFVSGNSAKWGAHAIKIEGVSHGEILDFKKRKISGIDIPGVYVQIVEGLTKMGL